MVTLQFAEEDPKMTQRSLSRTVRTGFIVLLLLGTGSLPRADAAQNGPRIEIEQFGERGSSLGTETIDGLLGGRLQVGRWTVIVPPGAIDGTVTITLKVPDKSRLQCELSISPESANKFLIPVTLVGNGFGGSISDPLSLRMLMLDPSTATWRPIGLSANSNFVITAQLWHFSEYAGGKAGW
jgi:hypothetical protein